MAFICVFVSVFIITLIFQGPTLRKFNLVREVTEDGVDLTQTPEHSMEKGPESSV